MAIEAGEWFIQQEDIRLDHERASQSHPLLLATREFGRPSFALGGRETHAVEQGVHALVALRARNTPDVESEGDIVASTEMGEEGIVLEDDPRIASLGWKMSDFMTGDHDLTIGRPQVPADQLKESRLATT